MPVDDDDEYDETKVMQVFGVHEPITFYGYLNMKASIEFPVVDQNDIQIDLMVRTLMSEKRKRI